VLYQALQRIAPDAMSTGCDFGLEGTEW